MSPSRTLASIYRAMRKLAKTNKYQLLYSQYKETGVRIFKNQYNLTDYQITFLQYLTFYSTLHTDIYMDEVSEVVLEDEIYEDSYIYYKQKAKKKKRRETNRNIRKPSQKNKPKASQTSNTHIVFSRPKK